MKGQKLRILPKTSKNQNYATFCKVRLCLWASTGIYYAEYVGKFLNKFFIFVKRKFNLGQIYLIFIDLKCFKKCCFFLITAISRKISKVFKK